MIHNLHHHHYHLSRMGEIKRIMWAHAIGLTGAGMVTIFIPIFLLESGYSIHAVFGLLALQGVAGGLATLVAGYLLASVRANHLMAAGVFFHGLQLFLLLTLGHFGWPLWLIAALYGLYI